MDCSNCGQPVDPSNAYCAGCGEPIPNDPTESSTFNTVHPNEPPSYWESYISYFLPFKTNELVQIRRFGGCPSCGEGQDLNITSDSKWLSFAGQVTGSVTCEECGATLDITTSGIEVTTGAPDIEGQTLSFSECGDYAESRRTDVSVGMAQSPEERLNHITGDYYWDTKVVDNKLWAAAAILCLIPPVGVFLISFLVFQSITTHPNE